MFEINTYILKKEIKKINGEKNQFCLCKDKECLKYITDFQYINDMIEIRYYGEEILGAAQWDLVDQLWWYFIDAFISLKEQDCVEFYFPDQPLKVRMTDKNGKFIILEVGIKRYCLPKIPFIQAMLEEAKRFFTILDYRERLEKIDTLAEDMIIL